MAARVPHSRVEPVDRWSVRFHHDRQVYRVYDVRVTPPFGSEPPGAPVPPRRVNKVPLGAPEAEARVFVPGPERDHDGQLVTPGRRMYVLHEQARRATDADTLAHQVRSAGWMQWMLHPVGSPSAR